MGRSIIKNNQTTFDEEIIKEERYSEYDWDNTDISTEKITEYAPYMFNLSNKKR